MWIHWGLSEWHESDITLDAMISLAGKSDIIVHCAGGSSVGFSMAYPAQDFDRTLVTTRNVLECARLHCPRVKIVLASSASVYGDAINVPISVTAPLRPVSPYGLHKQMAEELCLSYARHFGVPVAIVRLFSVYGVGLRKQLLWDACVKFAQGSATFGGTGQETRDWLHVDDAASLLLAAGFAASSNSLIMNGATGMGVSTRQVVGGISKGFRNSGALQFSGVLRKGDPKHLVADMGSTQTLNWRPERIFEVELERYVEWFKAGAL
jgi:UDP-glucose 4-epimerase